MWLNARCGNLGPTARKCRAPSAVAGQEYEFRVRALSAEGAGDWEESSTVTVPTESVPGRPTDLSVEIEDGQVVLMWQPPDDADETGVTAYEGAAWRYRHPEPGDAANKRVDAQRPYYIAENIAPGCALEARVRAVGRAGTSGYVYLDRGLRDPWPQDTVCEADRPATPTGVKATPKRGAEHQFVDGRYVIDVDVTWHAPTEGSVDEHEIDFRPRQARRIAATAITSEPPPFTLPLEPGEWTIEVRARKGGLTSASAGTATVTVPDLPPFTVGIREVHLTPQQDDTCPDVRSDYGRITSEIIDPRPQGRAHERFRRDRHRDGPRPPALVALDRPAPFDIARIARIKIGAEPADIVSHGTPARIEAGRAEATLTVRIICRDRSGKRIKNGHQVTLQVSEVEAVVRDNERYLQTDPTPHHVVVGTPYRSQTPVPSLPAAGSLILAAILAAIGNRRRRHQS